MTNTQTTIDSRQIGERVARIRSGIAGACERVGRDPAHVTLIAVTKTFPVEVVEAASQAGIRHFGENRVQELEVKTAGQPGLYQGGTVSWHLIGPLQRNKVKKAVPCMDVFQALDNMKLARELQKRLENENRILPCYVQVNVSGEESKFGLPPDRTIDFVRELMEYDRLEIKGLMTLAAFAEDPEDVRPQFRMLRELSEQVQEHIPRGDTMKHLSMGMSGDYEVAIEEGATHIRIGSAIFGLRSDDT